MTLSVRKVRLEFKALMSIFQWIGRHSESTAIQN